MMGDKDREPSSVVETTPQAGPVDGAPAESATGTAADAPPAVERVIERFGGIRPMAAKLDVPVTTVQGWKKRGSIPPPRHDDLRAAATRHGIVIDEEELALAGQHDSGQHDAGPQDAGPQDAGLHDPVAPAAQETTGETVQDKAQEAADESVEESVSAAVATAADREDAAAPGSGAKTGPEPEIIPPTAKRDDAPVSKTSDAEPEVLEGASVEAERVVEAPPHRAPPPAADQPSERSGGGSGWATAVSVIALVVAAAALSQPYWAPGDPTPAAPAAPAAMGRLATPAGSPVDETARATVASLAEKVEALSAAVSSGAAVPGTAPVSDSAAADLSARMEALKGDVARMGETLAALGASAPTTGAPPSAGDGAVAEALSALSMRIEAVETAAKSAAASAKAKPEAAASAASANGPVLALAVGQLRAAIAKGGAFGEELDMVRTVAGDDAVINESLAVLAPLASSGVPTLATLSKGFGAVAGDIVRADDGASDGDWLSEVWGRLRGLVMVRPRGGDASGDGAAAVTARAEAALAAGRPSEAVKELKTLTGPAAAVAASWLKDAEARAAVDAAGEALNRRAVTMLTGAAKESNGVTEGAR